MHAKGKLWKQMSMEFKFRIHFLLNKIMKARHNSGRAGGGGGGGGGICPPTFTPVVLFLKLQTK